MTLKNKAIIILLVLISLFVLSLISASAETKINNSIGIAFSKVYLTQLKLDSDMHPNYYDLVNLGLDNCNKQMSGDFKEIDGVFQRDTSNLLTNHWKFYTYHKDYLICIDPPAEMRSRVNMIYIESSLNTYKLKEQMIKENNTRQVSIDRYINKFCNTATIGADDYLKLLADTIHLLRNNCNYKISTFNHIVTIVDNSTVTDISTSQKYKEDTWKKDIKESHKEYKLGSDNSTNPSVTEDKNPKYVPPVTPPFDYSKYR